MNWHIKETINVNKKKSSSSSYIFHCSEEWKYKFYILRNMHFISLIILYISLLCIQ